MGLQNSWAVLVGRAAVVVVSMGGVIRFGMGGGVGVLARGVAIMQSDGFPVLKEVRERSEAQKSDSQINQTPSVYKARHCVCSYSQGSCLSRIRLDFASSGFRSWKG
jgi:hypothetical protein